MCRIEVIEVIDDGFFYIDARKRIACLLDNDLKLSSKEFDLLYCVATHAGEVLSIDALLDCVWGEDWVGEIQTIYVHMRQLRKKIEHDPNNPQHLLSVYGAGYKFVLATDTQLPSSENSERSHNTFHDNQT